MRSWLPFIVRARPFHAMWLTGVLRGAGSGLVDGLLVVAGPETGTACGLGGLTGEFLGGSTAIDRARQCDHGLAQVGCIRPHIPPGAERRGS